MAEKYQQYSNQISADGTGPLHIVPSERDTERLRALAHRYMEIAASDDMKVKKRQWKALRDLAPERPMLLFETLSIADFLTDAELLCENQYLRNAEHTLLQSIKQYEFVRDDVVLEPYFRLAWQIRRSDYGVSIVEHHAENSMGYLSNFPIATPDDIHKLKPREFFVDRERTTDYAETLRGIFGDIMPVYVGNFDEFFSDIGFNPFCGNNAPLTTMDIFKLLGNDNMIFWPYDYPDEFRYVIDFIKDDRRRFLKWLQDERLLCPNTDNQFAGPSGYGYVSALSQQDDPGKPAAASECWTWAESQEGAIYSPEMFDEWFLGAIADYCNEFGMVSYGCCERIDDRIEQVKRAIPKLRTVSVSGWSNFEKAADALRRDYVYCRKPNPTFLSGANADWKGAEDDIRRTWECTKDDCVVEFIVRDVYDINGDLSRITKWVELVKRITGI